VILHPIFFAVDIHSCSAGEVTVSLFNGLQHVGSSVRVDPWFIVPPRHHAATGSSTQATPGTGSQSGSPPESRVEVSEMGVAAVKGAFHGLRFENIDRGMLKHSNRMTSSSDMQQVPFGIQYHGLNDRTIMVPGRALIVPISLCICAEIVVTTRVGPWCAGENCNSVFQSRSRSCDDFSALGAPSVQSELLKPGK
jgi:hypothetical protein